MLALFMQLIAADPPEDPNAKWRNIFNFGLIPLVVLLFYYLTIRPARRDQLTRQQLLTNLKKNDRVLTSAGIFGVVVAIQADADEVTLRIDETNNTRIRVTLSSVARVFQDGAPEAKA